MNAEILAIGTELLMGQIANTDAQFLSRQLNEIGINVYHHTVVGDNPGRMEEALALALSRADLVITTGGLGPTADDMSKDIVAAHFGLSMVKDEASMRNLTNMFAHHAWSMTPNNERQAYFPEGAAILPNPNGTAPACIVEQDGKIVVVLPGPPNELQPIYLQSVRPYLIRKSNRRITSVMLRTMGLGESTVEDMLRNLIDTQTNPTLATYVGDGDVLLRITASTQEGEDPQGLLHPMVERVKDILGDAVYSQDGKDLPTVIVERLAAQGMTLAAAESCTGGMLSSRLVDVPGVSEVLVEGVVTYRNDSKMRRLGVQKTTLEQYGAVSQQTALEMARGVRQTSGATLGVATTGIAGPEGGTADKPVGTVYIAISGPEGERAEKLYIPRNRQQVRKTTVMRVLDLIRHYLDEKAK